MVDAQDLEKWVGETENSSPLLRFNARVNLLRNFPERGDPEVRQDIHSDLYRDVQQNPEEAVSYIGNLSELGERAYAVYFMNAPLSISPGERERKGKMKGKELRDFGKRDRRRTKFVRIVEGMLGEAPSIDKPQPRAKILEIIACEGNLINSLTALDFLWQIGWDQGFHDPFYETSVWYVKTVSNQLETIAVYANEQQVRFNALEYLGEIPDNKERREHLEHTICCKDGEIASRAVEVYVEKVKPIGANEDRLDSAVDAIFAKVRNIDGSILESANPKAVKRGFELAMQYAPEEKRLERAYGLFDSNLFTNHSVRRGSPDSLGPMVLLYMQDHVDDIVHVTDRSRRTMILVELACRGGKSALKAVDYLANTPENPIEGIEHVAYLLTKGGLRSYIHDETFDRVIEWACKYTGEFGKLEDKKLARSALGMLRGYEIEGYPGEFEMAYGRRGTDPVTGIKYDIIAREELAKLPPEETPKSRLKSVFTQQ